MFQVKKIIGRVMAATLLLTVSSTISWAETQAQAGPQASVFYDVTDHWAADAINYVVEKKLFSGTDPYVFSPEEEMSRGMFITVLSRTTKESVEGYENPFSDVPEDAYYRNAAAWASKIGLVSAGGKFQPDTGISRQEMAVLMDRMMAYMNKTPSAYTYGTENCETLCDAKDIAGYAKVAVQNMQDMNIITGKPGVKDGEAVRYFDPNKTASRAEVAVIIQRYMQNGE